ncbi:MAG: DUF4124 domain-containing protein [Sulfuriferula sp.]
MKKIIPIICLLLSMVHATTLLAAEDYLSELANPSQLAWQKTQPWWPNKLASIEQQIGQPNLAWQMKQPWWPNKLRELQVLAAQQDNSASTPVQKVAPSSDPVVAAAPASVKTNHVFESNSFWYTPIPIWATLDPNSANYVAEFLRQLSTYYGTIGIGTDSYTSPIYYADPTTPTTRVQEWDCTNRGYLDTNLQAQWSAVPIPAYAVQSAGSDGEMTIYQPSTHTIWEFWEARKVHGQWQACWGGQIDNASQSNGIFPFPYGTTATGLPFMGGQVTAEELKAGVINHVIGISLVNQAPWNVFSWPAQRSDGGYNPTNAPNQIPEGTRFRLDPSINVDTLNMTPVGKIVAKAAQKYGFVVWDKAGAISLRFENSLSYTQIGQPNPYIALFNGVPNYFIMNGFPWNKLQFLPMNYGKQ